MARIALFGGAFDPPHLGHVLCASYALAVGDVDELWVLPSHEHPYGKQMSPFNERLAWCQLAFAGLSRCHVRDDERHNPGGRTITLLEHLHHAEPRHTWWLVGGTDTERDMPQWYRGADLRQKLAGVIAVPRRGYDDAHPAALPAISSTQVRERLAQGKAITDLVPNQVATAILAAGRLPGRSVTE